MSCLGFLFSPSFIPYLGSLTLFCPEHWQQWKLELVSLPCNNEVRRLPPSNYIFFVSYLNSDQFSFPLEFVYQRKDKRIEVCGIWCPCPRPQEITLVTSSSYCRTFHLFIRISITFLLFLSVIPSQSMAVSESFLTNLVRSVARGPYSSNSTQTRQWG